MDAKARDEILRPHDFLRRYLFRHARYIIREHLWRHGLIEITSLAHTISNDAR